MSIIGTIYEDVTTDVLGSVGVWQWLVVVVSSMLTLPSLFNGYEDMLLLLPSGEVTCIPPERYEVFNSSVCTVTSITNSTDHIKCNRWQVKLFWMIWLKKSWFVYCEDKIRLLSTTMIYRMGLMFGCVIFGLIADSVGRRIAVIVELFAQLVLGAIITFCDSLAWFQLLVFLKSLFGGAKMFIGVILACEVASNKWRSSFNSIVSAPRLLAIVCMVPVANAVPNLETLSTLDTLFCSFLVVILRIGTIYEDVTTDVLGSVGVWQWLVVVVSSMLTLPSLFNGYEDMLLLLPSGEVTCIPPERYEVFNSSVCTVTSITNSTDHIKCNRWQVKLFWMIWLKKSWFVYCEDKIRLLSTTMIYRMGLMFGCVIFGLIADSVGRRIAVIVELFAQLVLGAIITFCDSLAWFQLLVFLKSLFGGAKMFIGVILACEVASNKWRSSFNSIVSAPRLLAIVCMVPVANAVPNLETLSTLDTLFCSFLVVILRWIPESPQWLLFNRKIYIAEKLLYHAAEKNGRKLWSQFKIRPVNHRAYNSLDERRTCAEILTTYNIRMIILVALLMWCLFWYQWSYLYVKVYSGNAKQLSTLLCFITLFCVVTFILSKKFILRHLLLINLLFFGIFSSSEIAFGHVVPNLFSSVALGSGVVVHALLMNMTPRLFALKIRATLVGCCHAVGQLGTMISYLFFAFQPLNNMIYVAVNTAITMALATLSLTLFDVDGRELPDMIDDMDYFSELSKPLRWATQKTNSPSKEEIEMRIYSFGSAPRASNSQEQERIPARRIGFTKFWRSISKRFQRTRPTQQ